MTDVTYIVLNYNPFGSEHITPRFVDTMDALYANSDPSISKEVIVIDQGSPDQTIQVTEDLRKKYGFMHLLAGKNLGIPGGLNTGFRMARGRVVALLTSDVIVTKGFDRSCLDILKNSQDIGHVIPLSDKGDNPRQVLRVPASFGTSDVSMHLPGGVEEVALAELTVNFFSRELIRLIGYFDERWVACYENMDYMFRTMLAGKKTVINRGAFAWHYHNTCSQYVGKLQFYRDRPDMQGDPFADGRLNKLWTSKWGKQVDADLNLVSWKLPPPITIRKYRAEHPSDIYNEWEGCK